MRTRELSASKQWPRGSWRVRAWRSVSDAGTPGISDPGARLVARARELGVSDHARAGCERAGDAAFGGGIRGDRFRISRVFPEKRGRTREELKLVRESTRLGLARLFVWFESPERIVEALEAFAQSEPRAQIVAAKELTKLHERFFAGNSQQAHAAVQAEIAAQGTRGEWCFATLLPAPDAARADSDDDSSDWVKALHCLLNAQVSASVAARQVSQQFGVPKNRVYDVALKLAGKKSAEGG